MSASRRPFRIEIAEPGPRSRADAADRSLGDRLERLLEEVADLRQAIESRGVAAPGPRGTNVVEPWAGVDDIQEAIATTRSEIGALRAKGITDPANNRAADELDAVVCDTETATETILAAAEEIDTLIQTFLPRSDQSAQAIAAEIQDNVVKIFEACNFQDISGQRISKVVGLLHFIEGRLRRMEEVWEIVASEPSTVGAEAGEDAVGELMDRDALLNGPALAVDEPVSQDEIDNLFR